MKAIFATKYGSPDVLHVREVKKPVPKDNEILVRVIAATVTPGDCEIRRFEMHVLFWLPLRLYLGIFKPRQPILGMEVAGEIESVGKDVTNFQVGDKIFGGTGLRFGAYAEYLCMNSAGPISLKPDEMSYEEAATIPTGGLNALHYIRKTNIQPGQKILINGAAGCFGTYAVQLAKNLGGEVTAVDSTDKLEVLRNIGADYVIDYTKEDFTKNGIAYDIIFDVVGKRSVMHAMKSLTKNGRYVLATPWVLQVLQGLWGSLISSRKFIFALAQESQEDLEEVKNQIAAGKLKPVIDKHYPLEQMKDAHTYVESGDKTGHVVITVNHS